MKKLFCLLAFAASLPVMTQTASAQVLFSDNFNGFTTNSGFPATATTGGGDFETSNPGRISGTLAAGLGTTPYINGGQTDFNEQTGDTTDLPADNLDNGVAGDNLLMASTGGGASEFVNFDFSTISAPITISFNALESNADTSNWTSFMIAPTLATGSGQPFVNGSGVDGILFRGNGGTQIFDHGTNVGGNGGAVVGADTWASYQIVLSNTAGTGSAFSGAGGTSLAYFENGVLLGTQSLGQLSGSQFIGFGGGSGTLTGIDDISISTTAVPEPSTYALLGGGLALLAFVVLRRKQVSLS